MGIRDPKSQWFLTYPRCDAELSLVLETLKVIDDIIHYVIASEKHEDGGKHIHVYVKFTTGVKLRDTKYFDLPKDLPDVWHGNYQPCRSPKSVIQYCTKEDNYICNFDIKTYLKKKGKLTISTVREKPVKQALEDEDITIYAVRPYITARSILLPSYTHSDVRGYWYVGPPGTGKTHKARTENPDAYLKAQNKWFDGYDGQKTIILDDLDKGAVFLGHYLKIWADKWPCSGEVKGAKAELVHEKFIVTSNYHIESLWDPETEPEMYEAISRRFTVVLFHSMFKKPRLILK